MVFYQSSCMDAKLVSFSNQQDHSLLPTGEIKWTAITLWHGVPEIQTEYRRKVGKKFTYPMYRPDLVPANPWSEQDAQSAKTNGSLPLLHGVIPSPPPIPPGFGPIAPIQAPAPVIQGRPRNAFPFDFWPSKPWDTEPSDDASLAAGISARPISKGMDHQALWQSTHPFMWPPQDQKDWRNGRFLEAGGHGFTQLWYQVDETNSIIQVSFCRISSILDEDT